MKNGYEKCIIQNQYQTTVQPLKAHKKKYPDTLRFEKTEKEKHRTIALLWSHRRRREKISILNINTRADLSFPVFDLCKMSRIEFCFILIYNDTVVASRWWIYFTTNVNFIFVVAVLYNVYLWDNYESVEVFKVNLR